MYLYIIYIYKIRNYVYIPIYVCVRAYIYTYTKINGIRSEKLILFVNKTNK